MGKLKAYHYWLAALFLCLLGAHQAAGQNYPVKIPEGSAREIRASEQDMWVLKESQFDSALAHSKRMKILEEQVQAMRVQIDSMKAKELEMTSLVDTLKHDRNFYKEKWKICEKDLQSMANKRSHESRIKKIFKITTFAGIPLAFVGGLIIAL